MLDILAPAGSFVDEGEVVATITDPERPGISHDVFSPNRGLLICTATHPFVTAGTPIGHLLPMKSGIKTLQKRLDDEGCLIISGSDGEPPAASGSDGGLSDLSTTGTSSGSGSVSLNGSSAAALVGTGDGGGVIPECQRPESC